MEQHSDCLEKHPAFLPDMCSLQAVFLLVLLGELLALALSLADSGLSAFDWGNLGLRSFLIQWIVLLSAALLCPLRPWLAQQRPWLAGLLSYLLVMSVAALCSGVGAWLLDGWQPRDWLLIGGNLLLAAIFSGVVLRYLYVQQQLHNQQQAELGARIQALQSRIQPHFLFNSMNSIASLIGSDPQMAERMIEDLSSLFRASLAESGLVPLSEELELCRHYLAIEQMRLGSRLQVRWQLSPEIEAAQQACPLPRLLLQPLLENAIHHGIQSRSEGGIIDIDVRLQAGQVQVRVVNPLPPPSVRHQGNQLALNNIRYRLQAHFGSAAQFRAQSEEACFVASLSYPAETGENKKCVGQ